MLTLRARSHPICGCPRVSPLSLQLHHRGNANREMQIRYEFSRKVLERNVKLGGFRNADNMYYWRCGRFEIFLYLFFLR